MSVHGFSVAGLSRKARSAYKRAALKRLLQETKSFLKPWQFDVADHSSTAVVVGAFG